VLSALIFITFAGLVAIGLGLMAFWQGQLHLRR
jgi:hypothetical protein